MRKLIYLFAIVALLCACHFEKPGPYRQTMEEFAKASISAPDSYEFDRDGPEREFTYGNALVQYRLELEGKITLPDADTAAIYAQDEKIQKAIDHFGLDSVACYEYSLYFRYKDGSRPRDGVIVARYDTNHKLIIMTMRPDTLPENAARQLMEEQGWL